MSLHLPKPVAEYFTADRGDGLAVGRCFTKNAVVKDEGKTYQGQAAIMQWKADTSKTFTYTTEPFACEEDNGRIIVTSRVAGNFPGSPVNLRYFFGIEDTRIASLEITP